MTTERETVPKAPTYYVTTSIPYVNARPHLGHAMEFVLTDALARYHRLRGDDTWFLTGTDENSLKNVQAAEREGLPVQELVDRNAAYYDELRQTSRALQRRFHPHQPRSAAPGGGASALGGVRAQRRHLSQHLPGPVLRWLRTVLYAR